MDCAGLHPHNGSLALPCSAATELSSFSRSTLQVLGCSNIISDCIILCARYGTCKSGPKIVLIFDEISVDSTFSHILHLFTTGKSYAFALSVIDSALSLLSLMNQSTLHYALELVSVTVKHFLDPSIPSNVSAVVPPALIVSAARIVQVSHINIYLPLFHLFDVLI